MFPVHNTTKNILTVSKLNRLARSVLEAEIGQIWLSAEISNFVAASSGHWYFTLKDDRAQVKGAMFKGANRKVHQKPKEGDKVLVKANISLYEPRGDYQIIVEHMEPEGEGQLKQQFEVLKRQLASEGIFAQEFKKQIPEIVLKVGIVTSPTGAALHDILTVLQRRNPAIEVVIYPSQVQGDSAVSLICAAITQANLRDEVDVLIVGRGGGSLEDLWCFNSEQVARTIFASSIPIISAVGHEIDVSIADFVADMRAPTPSAAAELVSQDQSTLHNKTLILQDKLLKAFSRLQQARLHQHQAVKQRLLHNHPQKQLEQKSQYVDQLHASLQSAIKQILTQVKQRQEHIYSRLSLTSPQKLLQRHQLRLQELQTKLQRSCQQLVDNKQQKLLNNMHLLDTVSPLATLARGYSISFKHGEIVKNTQQVQVGDVLVTRLEDGEVHSKINQIQE
ncbi:exodeoxyribonuclease VII large subunit [Paraglaciecola sp. MB-3u-78]|uniref:exodeoxyribonuclease VII large subunit n=1 Tax=Paraglaciecola sp. MB-3u-78 TaxID=2058332 RepID=UPI000C32A973|nr:exodeoxyribonuclease VII large subunit [Paraglaciecola sp. MB-3u-78]PKH00598.1 exodeoxyribonuclease VII large subunit [Paraglaciecola sp. MB-3u-78]